MIGLAVFAFLVLSVISPLPVIIWGAVIMFALAYARTIREKRYQGEIKRLKTANVMLTLDLCEAASPASLERAKYPMTRRLIDFFMEEKDPPAFFLRCAEAILKMGTEGMVEIESQKNDLAPWQRENLGRLKRKIENLLEREIRVQ